MIKNNTSKHEAIIRIALSRTTMESAMDAWTAQAINGPTTPKNREVLEAKLHVARHGSDLRNMAPMTKTEKRALTLAMKHFGL